MIFPEYCKEYNNCLFESIDVDETIRLHDAEVKEKEEQMKDNEPDEEGWVTVLKK